MIWSLDCKVQGSTPQWAKSQYFSCWTKFMHRLKGPCELASEVKKSIIWTLPKIMYIWPYSHNQYEHYLNVWFVYRDHCLQRKVSTVHINFRIQLLKLTLKLCSFMRYLSHEFSFQFALQQLSNRLKYLNSWLFYDILLF